MFNDADVKIETMRGRGKGGQRKNKVETCVRVTHVPTGISVRIDGRNQTQNKKVALKLLAKEVEAGILAEKAASKKAKRDKAIHNEVTIRTYNFSRDEVKDLRTGKTASIKNILGKARLELLR